jgi:hypothetical protein
VFEASGQVSGGVCDDCQHNTVGHKCEQCIAFFYLSPGREISDVDACQRKAINKKNDLGAKFHLPNVLIFV